MEDMASCGGTTDYVHARGHSGDEGNSHADKCAKAGAELNTVDRINRVEQCTNMETQGQFVWRYDNGWDNVSVEAKHYDAMRRLFVYKGYLMTWNGNFYVFAAGERCWVLLVSDTGAKS
ncbi:hypothetical protein BELL_1057g00030 [Botrytis elliptica]|uniref:Uncharacterized protein n=1 Tax=Botrytis elliptica TaxID=278938 RepID=A0A4Z1J4G1_9HELO|nr:hypothetical protein BELL_1057g00030 [Botrytis elliptica]